MTPSPATPARIQLRGVREAGLGGRDLSLPLGQLVCLRGASGAGAEMLARRVLLGESRRRYLMSLTPFERDRLGGVGAAADIDGAQGLPPAQRLPGPDGAAVVAQRLHLLGDLEQWARAHARVVCGACGGDCRSYHEEQVAACIDDTFADEACLIIAPLTLSSGTAVDGVLTELGRAGFRRVRVGGDVVRLDDATLTAGDPAAQIVEEGILQVVVDRLSAGGRRRSRVGEAVRTARAIAGGRTLLFGDSSGTCLWADSRRACTRCGRPCAEPDWQSLIRGQACDTPQVHLDGAPAAARLGALCLEDVGAWSRTSSIDGGTDGGTDGAAAEPHRVEASRSRLGRAGDIAADLGLGRLPIWRSLTQLADGERLLVGIAAARVTGLSGVLHVVEAPPSALDPHTRERALQGLRALVDAGGSVVVVDGDPRAEAWADVVVDLGPDDPKRATDDPAQAVDRTPTSPAPAPAGDVVDTLVVEGGPREGALPPGPRIEIPLGAFVVLAGPTGAGKTALLRHLRQSLRPRGRGERRVTAPAVRRCTDLSVPETADTGDRALLAGLLGVMRPLARLLADSAAAREAGYGVDSFSLDRAGGRCPVCEGKGSVRHRLDLVEDIAVTCSRCGGQRFRDEVLAVTAHGLNLAELLALTVAQAADRLARDRGVGEALADAVLAGLGTRQLGTPCSALEGAEALLARLVRQRHRARRGDLVLVDRPLAGCTQADAVRVTAALRRLCLAGAGIIATDAAGRLAPLADCVIDLPCAAS